MLTVPISMNCLCLSVAVLLVTSTCQDASHCTDVHHEVNFLQSQKHLELSAASTGKGPAPLIPNKLTFNHWYNLLEGADCPEKRNVLRLIEMHPNADVLFYNDTQCREAIVRVHSEELAQYFDTEPEGYFKSDSCRVAMLLENGGYYYDSDIDLLKNVQPFIPASASLATATAGDPNGILVHQGFLASVPGHPVLYDSLDYHLEYYKFNEEKGHQGFLRRFPPKYNKLLGIGEGRESWVLLGPMALGLALMKWGGVERLPTGRFPGPGATDLAYFLNHTVPQEGINETYGYAWRGCHSDLAAAPTQMFAWPGTVPEGKSPITYCNVGLVDVEQKELLGWTTGLNECCVGYD